MPRGSSRSSSSKSTSRTTATKTAPPTNTQNNQVAPRGGMASGLMGSLMSGMAFGAGSEMLRQLFRNPTTGQYMLPLIVSGLTAFGANKLCKMNNTPYRGAITLAVFGGTFIASKKMFGENNEYNH
jgi:predicted lipid-binding transport protein (Tim44 family)